MSEKHNNQEPKPQDPELTESQKAVKALCEEIFALKPPHIKLTYEGFITRVDANAVESALRESTLADLMLKDGATLSAKRTGDYEAELGLFVGKAELVSAEIRGWFWERTKYRIDPNGPTSAPYDVIDYPGELDWAHKLDIRLRYSNGDQSAIQTVSAYTSSAQAGELPSMSRDVYAPAYAEMGYAGHNQRVREARSDKEVLGFVALARELFDERIERQPI